MATITEPRELFVNELNAMMYVEQRLAEEVLPELANEITSDEFKENVRHHIDETKQQIGYQRHDYRCDRQHAVGALA